MKRKSLIILACILLVSLIVSCNTEVVESYGTLVLELNSDITRTITPDLDMEITDYTISGTGPDRQTFSVTQSAASSVFVQDELRVGDWEITVEALNIDGVIIGSGSVSLTIEQYISTEADISVTPLSGQGSIAYLVTYNVNDFIVLPEITVDLVPESFISGYISGTLEEGWTPMTLEVVESEDVNMFGYGDFFDVETGYYMLNTTFRDEGNVIWSKVEMVRIVASETTNVEYIVSSDEINQLEGGISLNITENMDEPLLVQLGFSGVYQIEVDPLQARISVETPGESFMWIVDGEHIENDTAELTIHNIIEGKVYYVTVIVTDGEQVGSARITFNDDVIIYDGDLLPM